MSKKMLDRFCEQLEIQGLLDSQSVHRRFAFVSNCISPDEEIVQRVLVKPGEKALVGKFDGITIIVGKCSISRFFDFLGFTDLIDFDDLKLSRPFQRDAQFDDKICWRWNGLDFSFSIYDNTDYEDDLFHYELEDLRIDFSGQGLDFLRSEGIDCEVFFKDLNKFYEWFGLSGFHFTRVDIAFDFINFNEDMIDKLLKYIDNNKTVSGFIGLCNIARPIVYELNLSSGSTIYFGSKASAKRLTIYDKKAEQSDPITGEYIRANPYSNPSSWIRIEARYRKKEADKIISASNDNFFDYLMHIYKSYPLKDQSCKGNVLHRVWRDIFYADEDFLTLKKLDLAHNIHFVSYITRDEKIFTWLDRNASILREAQFACLSRGFSLDEYIEDRSIKRQIPLDDPVLERRRVRQQRMLSSRLSQHSNYKEMHLSVFKVNDQGYVCLKSLFTV